MFIIAEIAQSHDGSLGIAHSYIEALENSGVDAIKFQTHIADAESSKYEPFRIPFSYQDKSRYAYWKRMEFSLEEWIGLKEHCEKCGLEFMSSPFSIAAVELLENVGVKRYKVGSGEVNNLLMLDRIGKTGKPIILSSGMSSYSELDNSINFLKKYDSEISLLQCTTSYPTKPEQWGLNVIQELKDRYNIKIGFSDHSGEIYSSIAATALGAEILEFHVVFDKKMFGPDNSSSLTIKQIHSLVKGVKDIEKSLSNKVYKDNLEAFENNKQIFEKSLAVNRDLEAGEVITQDMLEGKKPKGYGINASEFSNVIGRILKNSLKKWHFINWSDLK